MLAEFFVARALDLATGCRVEWDACDLRTPDGFGIEIKSAAYVQSWAQTRPSAIRFGVQPGYAWDAATNTSGVERRRAADVYVFCVLHHGDRETLDPLNVQQWRFYVLPTRVLDQTIPLQKTLTLSALLSLKPAECEYEGLAGAVREVTDTLRWRNPSEHDSGGISTR